MIAIFDIDGTLTQSQAVDNDCFVDAFEIAFGIRDVDTNWSNYPHTTERALTAEILRRAGHAGDERDLEKHRAIFVSLLAERAGEIGEIAGARDFLAELERRGWSVALATGAWSASARLKLRAAGFSEHLHLACCDAASTREEIVKQAISMAGGEPPVVLFGDAEWDVRTAASLRLPIVGIGAHANGAHAHLKDYRDAAHALAVIESLVYRSPRSP